MINRHMDFISVSFWLSTMASLSMLTSCSQLDTEPVIIGVLLDMPTPGGLPSKNAAILATKEVNAKGGLKIGCGPSKKPPNLCRHRLVTLVFEDTNDTPTGAIAAMRRLISTQNLVAIIGPNVSRNAIAVANIAEDNKTPMVSPGSTHPETTLGKNFVFRASYTDPVQGFLLSGFAKKHLRIEKSAILYDISRPTSRSVAQTFKQGFESQGGQITDFISYVTGETNFEVLLTQALDGQPEALLLPNPSSDTLIQASILKNISPNLILLGTDSWSASAIDKIDDMQGAYYTHHWHPSVAKLNAQNKKFVTRFEQEYGETPATMAALTYDAFSILFSAIESGGTNSIALRNALATTEFAHGVTGPISFSDGGNPQKDPMILTIKNQVSQTYPWSRQKQPEDFPDIYQSRKDQ